MRLALIPPDSLAEMMKLTDLHLLLPEQLARLAPDFIRSLKGYRILDNGVAEGDIVGINKLLELVDTWEIDELVLPDVMQDFDETVRSARSYRHLKVDRPKLKLMGVAQGKNESEIIACIRAMQYMDHVDIIGIPRWTMSVMGSSFRVAMLQWIDKDEDITKPVHCLGANPVWPEEPLALRRYTQVRSMDTSLPFVYGLRRTHLPDKHEFWRMANYFAEMPMTDYQLGVIEDNVRLYIRWAGAEASASQV